MRLVTTSALVLGLGIVCASAALADEKDTPAACMAANSQVAAALNAQQNDAARHEQRLAEQACASHFYHVGMVHYARAMELLGIKS
jgi:hypothetical protein